MKSPNNAYCPFCGDVMTIKKTVIKHSEDWTYTCETCKKEYQFRAVK
jgi:transcription elongation factor Elf1